MSSVVEIAADGEEAITLARTDFNFLAMLIDPDEFTLLFPQFYLTLFSLLTGFKKKLEYYAIGIPRGFAKTTFIKLLCVWYILFTDKKFILIVGGAEKLAMNTLADICDMLSSRNIRALFGNWQAQIEEDTKEQKVFYFRGRNIIIKAIGANTSIRGINRKSARPDVILLDDVQKKEDAENAELADELLKWILGTLMKARSNFGCTYIYVGNMYPQNCILEKLRHNPQWTSLIVGGILADGTSLWEELKPVEELLAEYESDVAMGHPEIFISEVLNSTEITAEGGIDISKIPEIPDYFMEVEPDGGFLLIDPSSGKKKGDDCTLSVFDVVDGIPIFSELESGTFSPLQTIEAALRLASARGIRLICVEDTAYQSTLLFWFNYVCEQHGITGFEFHPVSPKNRHKNTRIKGGALSLIAKEIYLGPAVRSRVLAQYKEWKPLKQTNDDDIIDPIGYVAEVMKLYAPYVIKLTFDVDAQIAQATHSDNLDGIVSMGLPY